MRTSCRLLATALVLMATAGATVTGAAEQEQIYRQKRYGIVVDMPKGRIGSWNIAGRRVEVTKETHLDEARGKAEKGAVVEATGKKQGNIFKAYKIEVKIPKKPAP